LKIAFWSSAKEKIGVTSNLACISVASVLEYSFRVILFENHCQKNRLENILRYHNTNYCLREDHNYKIGEVVLGQVIEEAYNVYQEASQVTTEISNVIRKASMEILDSSLYYIPPANITNTRTFDFDLYDKVESILDVFETFADIIYIDTSNGNNLSSKIILDEVDLVVVNLAQNNSMIQHFFDNYSSILHKCVFIISSYRKKSKLNINKIFKTHLIDKSNIAIIPYNFEYQEAVSHGNIVEFLMRNFSCKRSHPNYIFIKEVKKAVEMIMRNIELSHKEVYL